MLSVILSASIIGLPMSDLRISDEVVSLIKEEEGLVLTAYWDVDSYAIGYGSKRGVYAGMSISADDADRRLREDIQIAEQEVREELSHIPLNLNQFSALVSLVFNAGVSPILPGKTIRRALEKGDYLSAANGFNLWVTDGAQTLPSLVARRELERSIFLREETRQVSLTATMNTYMKAKPSSSILELAEGEFSFIEKGSTISGLLTGSLRGHYRLDVEGSTYYLFSKHFTLP